jgi:preprotein translocase subunit SecE
MIDAKLRDVTIEPETKRFKAAVVIREFKEELKKVSWTTKDELKLFTKIVIGATFVFGLGIYLVDLIIKGCLHQIGNIVRWIFG